MIGTLLSATRAIHGATLCTTRFDARHFTGFNLTSPFPAETYSVLREPILLPVEPRKVHISVYRSVARFVAPLAFIILNARTGGPFLD